MWIILFPGPFRLWKILLIIYFCTDGIKRLNKKRCKFKKKLQSYYTSIWLLSIIYLFKILHFKYVYLFDDICVKDKNNFKNHEMFLWKRTSMLLTF